MTAREEFVCENFCEYKVVLPGKGEGPSLAGRNKVLPVWCPGIHWMHAQFLGKNDFFYMYISVYELLA